MNCSEGIAQLIFAKLDKGNKCDGREDKNISVEEIGNPTGPALDQFNKIANSGEGNNNANQINMSEFTDGLLSAIGENATFTVAARGGKETSDGVIHKDEFMRLIKDDKKELGEHIFNYIAGDDKLIQPSELCITVEGDVCKTPGQGGGRRGRRGSARRARGRGRSSRRGSARRARGRGRSGRRGSVKRARGRQMNFKIASEDVGVQWQLGTTRVDFRTDGRRG